MGNKLEKLTNFIEGPGESFGSDEPTGSSMTVTAVDTVNKTITLSSEDRLVEHVYENPDPNAKPLQPGDEGYVDPDALEKKLVTEELERMNKEPDQEEIACMMIKLYTPRFNNMVDKLSNRSLRRVMKSLMEYPIGKEYRHPSREEEECFMIGNAINDAKMVLAIKTYHDHADEIVAAAAKEAMKGATLEFGDKAVEAMNDKPKEVNNNG